MLQQLINHNDDLKQLVDEGFELELKSNHLLIKNVPYVNSQKSIQYGVLVSTLCYSGNKTLKPDNHVIYFIGDSPCHKNGSVIKQILHQSLNKDLGNDLIVNRSFSNKPAQGFSNYYEKMVHYINIISSPAESIDKSVSAKKFKQPISTEEECVFMYADTNSSRAGIDFINRKVAGLKIAIIGLGGTGSYILDSVSKTPVAEIHLFDGDFLEQHNAFRAPGAIENSLFSSELYKTDHYKQYYGNMHKNIYSHAHFIDSSNIHELAEIDFVFISIDKGLIKREIIDFLEKNKISFIDVGIGVEIVEDQLIGTIRTTSSVPEKRDHVLKRISFSDRENDEYSTNIQIAELNSLNATLAVIKWKKIYGIYVDNINEHHTTYSINLHQLLGEDNVS